LGCFQLEAVVVVSFNPSPAFSVSFGSQVDMTAKQEHYSPGPHDDGGYASSSGHCPSPTLHQVHISETGKLQWHHDARPHPPPPPTPC